MATFWEQIRTLDGRTLTTVSRRNGFDIAKVNDSHVQMVPRSGGASRAGFDQTSFEHRDGRTGTILDVTLLDGA